MTTTTGGKTVRWPSANLAVFKSASPVRSPSAAAAGKTRRRLRPCMHGPYRDGNGKCPRRPKPRYICMYGDRGLNDKCPRATTAQRRTRAKAAAKAKWNKHYAD